MQCLAGGLSQQAHIALDLCPEFDPDCRTSMDKAYSNSNPSQTAPPSLSAMTASEKAKGERQVTILRVDAELKGCLRSTFSSLLKTSLTRGLAFGWVPVLDVASYCNFDYCCAYSDYSTQPQISKYTGPPGKNYRLLNP
jgi:hypothetical protein